MRYGRLYILCAALLLTTTVRTAAAASASILTGEVQIMAVDFRDRTPTTEVYLHSGLRTGSAFIKLEGPMVGQLRTGQRVSGSQAQAQAGPLGAKSAGARAKAAASPQRVQVSGIQVLAEPAHPSSQATVSHPAAGGSGTGRRLQQQRLPTVKLPVMTTDVSTLLLPLSFEGCPNPMGGVYEAPWWTQQDLEAVTFDDGTPGSAWTTVGGRFRSCSHGQTTLTRATSAVAPVIKLPCTGITAMGTPYDTRECSFFDYISFHEVALQQLKAQGFDFSKYRHHLVVLPLDNSCPWTGMADLGCGTTCTAWVQGDTLMGFQRGDTPATHPVLHEIGHNLYLQHATTSTPAGAVINEYGDTSCPMGKCCSNRCYNTAHSWQLGWLAPQVLDGTSLGPGQARTVTFYAQTRSKLSGLQINATWAPGSTPLYLSYRLTERGDKGLEQQFVSRVLVHSFPGRSNYDVAFTRQLAVLPTGGKFMHDASGLLIQVTATNPRLGTATVTVTRVGSRRVRRVRKLL